MDIGTKIRNAREAKGLTQSELGKRCGTTKQTIFKYESNLVTNIPMNRLLKIADALEISPAYLMGWEDAKAALNEAGWGIEDLASEMGMPIKVLEKAVSTTDIKSPELLKKIIQIAELLAKETPTPVSESELSTDEAIQIFDSLSESQKEKARDYLRYLKAQEDNQ